MEGKVVVVNLVLVVLVFGAGSGFEFPQQQVLIPREFSRHRLFELVIDQDPADPNTNLMAIKQDTLGNVSFERVRILGTKLVSVEAYAFSNSYQTLIHLDLTNNNIQNFPFASLPRYVSLQTFIIEGNAVASLHHIISTSLQVLSASFNPLSTLEVSTLTGSPALTEVYLGHADLNTLDPGHFTHLANLSTLHLDGNTITVLEYQAIVTPSNTISYLNLNSNELTFVRHDAISGLSSDATLSLRNNALTTLEEVSWLHVFQQLYPDGVIDLSGNPLVCGCDLAWIMLDSQDRYRPLITDTTRCGVNGPILVFLDPAFFEQQCQP
ncbi:hypothetical protein Pcinc_040733 [Petrolisthes cinctipes]|uniref:Uncharacterized protein n=1 Tax=Petrolisthes cinctipes TaxID=88211 RepID=A0AAE1EKI8_PETCI|nr:hypothetical protein Pcinc_040733 [Petrolisthes cinctipes]